ncbi:MAG TPA: septum site-determining protein MinC [Bacillota bacterium]|nr:septum site-determining protein MinC [Bacillota bacterium]
MAEEKDTAMAQLAKDSTGIVFKGYRSGLILVIPEEGSFETYLGELAEHLNKARSFFKGAKVTIQTGNRNVTDQEQTALANILKEHGLLIQQLPNVTETAAPKINIRKEKSEFIDTITVKKTVRSGQTIRFEGNLLIIGDVNPGAEVIASGDIVVLGKLRGIAHAGANGDNTAQIFALQLNPVQIRIAGIFTRDSEKRKGFKNTSSGPEVARIKDNMIVVERY